MQRFGIVLIHLLCTVLGRPGRALRSEDSSRASHSLASLLYASSPSTIRPGSHHLPIQNGVQMQWGFPWSKEKLVKATTQASTRVALQQAWKKADAYRPGAPNTFVTEQRDLAALHRELKPQIETLEKKGHDVLLPGARNGTSLLGALLKCLTTGDVSLSLCSPEAPVLKELREWLVKKLPISDAIRGLPEEQGRVLSTIALALDARKIIDLGTFIGYSSLAMALPTASDARVICSERNAYWANKALLWWDKAGCREKMEMHMEDAGILLQRMIDNGESGSVDMIFCDIDEREKYSDIHEQAMQLLRVGGMVIYYDTLWAADRSLDHAYFPKMRAFNEKLTRDPRNVCSLVPLSYGLTICTKTIDLDSIALKDTQGDIELLRKLLLERRAAVDAEREEVSRALASA